MNPPGKRVDKVHQWDSPKQIIVDMDSSISPTCENQKDSTCNGHFERTCYHPLLFLRDFWHSQRDSA